MLYVAHCHNMDSSKNKCHCKGDWYCNYFKVMILTAPVRTENRHNNNIIPYFGKLICITLDRSLGFISSTFRLYTDCIEREIRVFGIFPRKVKIKWLWNQYNKLNLESKTRSRKISRRHVPLHWTSSILSATTIYVYHNYYITLKNDYKPIHHWLQCRIKVYYIIILCIIDRTRDRWNGFEIRSHFSFVHFSVRQTITRRTHSGVSQIVFFFLYIILYTYTYY